MKHREAPTPPRRVLVLRLSSVGDVVLTSGALSTLKRAWPETEIVFVTKPGPAELVRHHPAVSRVYELTDGERSDALRAFDADAVLDLHGKLRTRRLAAGTKAPRQVRWTKRPLLDSLLVGLRLKRYRATCTIAARHHAAVERLVGRALEPSPLTYVVGSEAMERADAALRAVGVDPGASIVGISPGALWATKRWPVERFGQLALGATSLGHRVVLTGTPDERDLTRAVCAIARGAVDLAGSLRLAELGGVIARCRAFVANDSGPMHMARALGVPTLAFFGSTDPRQFDFAEHELGWANVSCAPCSLHGLMRCPRGHFRCMNDLSSEAAHGALQRLLSVGRAAPVLG